ncbi:MAG: ATP-binding protein, partial [Motilibacteraceae bacterium]
RGLAAAAGVATGRVSGTGDLPPIGAPLVESAGLAHRADEGRLLVDAPTRERVAHLVEAVDAGDGTAEVVRLRLPSPGPRTLSATRFVGRARDLATLRAAFDQTVGDRRTHLVTVVAEAGVGKSRLVQEFAASVVDVCTWRTGHCRPYGDQVAYEPLLQVVRRHAGIDPSHVASEDRSDRLSDIRSELRGKLLAVLPPADGELVADRLAPLLGGPTDLAPSKGEAQRALRLVLQSMAHGGPAVLHLEDVHWAAPPLLDLLDQLVADPEPVPLLVLTTARPELFRHRPGWGSGEAPGTTLVLAPLDERETLSLLESLSTGDADREELARRSGGNPFFAEELARAAQHPDGAPTAALDALVEARLDALPDDQRALLLAASVAGHQFSAVQVAGLVGRDPDDVAEQLSALVRKQFLRRATTGGRPGAGLEFVHDLVEHTAYARLLPDTRARHHLAVAGFWRGPDGRGLAAHADLVAHHELTAHEAALDGHDVVLAETARGQAAQSALEAGVRVQGFDTTTARRLLARVMELTEPGSDDHAVALLRLAGVEFDAGDFGRARELLLPALAHFDGRDDELFTDAVLYWATVLFALGEPLDDAAEANRRALERMAPSRSLVRGLGLEGMIHLVRQTTESMRRTLQVSARAIAVDEQTGCGGSGFAHVLHGRARVALGDEGGLDELEAWLDDVERHELASLAHGAWQWWAGAVHHWRGSAEEHRARQRLTYLAESRGLGFLRSMGAAEHVRVLWELGRLRECVDLADAVDLADGAMPRWAVVQRALALADLGELDEATVDIVRTTPPADPGDLRHLAGTAAVAMHAALAVGDVAGARRALEFLGDLRPYVERDGAFELLPRLVRLALQADAADLVLDVDGIDRPPTPLRSHVATHVRGLQALARGDVDDARRLLEEAAQRWAAFGTVSEERAARAELARVLPA